MAEYDFRSLSPHDFELLCRDLLQRVLRVRLESFSVSTPVLERVLHAGIFTDSDTHLERIRLRLSRYVPNESFNRAQALLEKSHFCIVAGIPGIGKTTLAEVLLADLVDRHGFTAYRIAHDLRIDLTLCVVNLSDYTRPIRAKILYNHIYFSDLPKDYKLALLEDHGYEAILAHRNYNPRVIEYMTQARHARSVAPSLYRRQFVDSLDNPGTVWDHAFRHQISEAARNLLLVLTTMPDESELENLEKAFWNFHGLRQKRFGFPTSAGDWIDALKELDGNFIKSVFGDERDALKSQFLAFASDHPLRWDDDPDGLRQVAADLEYVGERLEVDTREFTQGFLERADEIETERAEQEPPDDDERSWESSEPHVDDVQGMFDGLQSDLKDR